VVSSRSLDNVILHDEIDPAEIPGLLAHCQVGIVALDPRHKTHNVPGKFLTYLRAGIPVLARINPGNDLEKLINEEHVGRVCIGGDAAKLHELVNEMLANPAELRVMGDRGRSAWQRLFTPTIAVETIMSALVR
jgi:glycosyltransferase involved in cell wall biosynthesis